jgi:hypothetical protein
VRREDRFLACCSHYYNPSFLKIVIPSRPQPHSCGEDERGICFFGVPPEQQIPRPKIGARNYNTCIARLGVLPLCNRFWVAQRFSAAVSAAFSIGALAPEGSSIPPL